MTTILLVAGFWFVIALLIGWRLHFGSDTYEVSGVETTPCQPCQRGYGEMHVCAAPRSCGCDQEPKHLDVPEWIAMHLGAGHMVHLRVNGWECDCKARCPA